MPEQDPIAMDAAVGGDGDIGGIAQPITVADIDAIVISGAPLETRRQQLQELQSDLEVRDAGDFGNDMDVLLQRINDALINLEADGDGVAATDSILATSENRVDAVSPDEIGDVLRDKL
ncbi:MAG: hypothetical protein AAFV26_07345 [Pseudomonadota bacterium]